jgi:hypothetical protein
VVIGSGEAGATGLTGGGVVIGPVPAGGGGVGSGGGGSLGAGVGETGVGLVVVDPESVVVGGGVDAGGAAGLLAGGGLGGGVEDAWPLGAWLVLVGAGSTVGSVCVWSRPVGVALVFVGGVVAP